MTVSRFDPLSAVLFPAKKVPCFRRFRKFINQNVGIGNSESVDFSCGRRSRWSSYSLRPRRIRHGCHSTIRGHTPAARPDFAAKFGVVFPARIIHA
jgi:hypothetical protein